MHLNVCVCVLAGTGASCIYPLLGASMNGWYFLATEVDDVCYTYAKKNVEQNNMADLIKGLSLYIHRSGIRIVFDTSLCKISAWVLLCVCVAVVKVPQKTLLMDALKEESIVYDFCMCNPPFFANHLEAKVTVFSSSQT